MNGEGCGTSIIDDGSISISKKVWKNKMFRHFEQYMNINIYKKLIRKLKIIH